MNFVDYGNKPRRCFTTPRTGRSACDFITGKATYSHFITGKATYSHFITGKAT